MNENAASLCGTSLAASPVGKDGAIHACYKVKGKPKGTLRIVGPQKRCKRGERKVVWNAAGQDGQSGAAGQAGSADSGQPGQAGADGSSANEAALKTQIASLNVKVDGLEKVLEGVTHGDLTGVLSTLSGVTNPELQNAIGSVPLLEEVCGQTEELTVDPTRCLACSTHLTRSTCCPCRWRFPRSTSVRLRKGRLFSPTARAPWWCVGRFTLPGHG
jgi:hypothetical protein